MLVQVPQQGALVLLVGVPGSGKSTLVGKLLARGEIHRDEVISSDEFRKRFTGDAKRVDDDTNKKVFATIHEIVDTRLANGKVAIVDATNTQPDHRKALVDIANKRGAAKIAIVLKIPLAECLQNNAKRRRRASEAFMREEAKLLEKALSKLSAEGFSPVYMVSKLSELDDLHVVRSEVYGSEME